MTLMKTIAVGLFWVSVAQASPAQPQSLLLDLKNQLSKTVSKKETPSRWVQEARLQFYLGKISTDPKEKEAYFNQGVERAMEARNANSEDLAASFWWSANLGGIAGVKRNFSSLSLVRDIERELLGLKSKNADFEYAAADRRLGRLYQKAPSLFSIGSMRKAGEHLHEAFNRFPTYPGNQVFLADYLLEKKEYQRAHQLAQAALDSPALSQFPFDAPEWKEIASQVVEKASKKIK